MANLPQMQRTKMHGILELWETRLEDYSGDLQCQLPGFEFLLPPYPVDAIYRDGKWSKTTSNSVHIFNGFEGHTEKFVKAKASLKSLFIPGKYISKLSEPLGLKAEEITFPVIELQNDPELTAMLKLIARLAENADQTTEFSLDCVTTEMLLALLVRHKHSHHKTFAREDHHGQFPGTLDRIKSTLYRNLENPDFDLDQLSQQSGISKFHLIRVFKKGAGTSPAKYLNQIKMDMAKLSLRQSKKTVLAIAMELGFSDLSTFNKAFKKTTGISPRDFRQQGSIKQVNEEV